MQRTESTVSDLKTPLRVLCLRLSSWWRKPNFWWLRITSSKIEPKKKQFLEFSDCQDTDARKKVNNSPIQKISTTKKFLAIEEIKPAVFSELWVWISEKIKIKLASEISDFQDTDARKRNKGFLFEDLSTSAVFSNQSVMEEIEMWWLRFKSLDIAWNQN